MLMILAVARCPNDKAVRKFSHVLYAFNQTVADGGPTIFCILSFFSQYGIWQEGISKILAGIARSVDTGLSIIKKHYKYYLLEKVSTRFLTSRS